MAWWVLLVLGCLVLAFLALLTKRRQLVSDSSGRGIPCPPKSSQGHHGALIAKAGGLIPFVKRLHEDYGAVVEFWLSDSTPIVSCNDPDLLKKTLKLGSRPIPLFKFLAAVLTSDNMQVFDAERAKGIRRLLASPVGHQHIDFKYDDVVEHARHLVETWEGKGNGAVVALQEELLGFALRAVLSIITGERGSGINFKEFQRAYDDTLSGTFDSQFGISQERKEKLNNSIAFIKDTIYVIIENKRKALEADGHTSLEENPNPDLLETLLLSNDPATQRPFEKEKIYSLLAAYLLAAYHTSIVGVTWTLLLLCQHPEEQQKVDEVLKGRVPDIQDLDKLEYLGQVIKESMRIYTPGPFAARLIEEETRLGDFVLPKETTLFYPLSVIHMGEKHWPQPTVFNPDRFSPTNIKNILPGRYVPFGMGARQCPGDRVAWMEMRLLLSLFFQRFSFSLDEASVKDIIPVERFVLWADKDIHVVLHPRNL